MNEILHASNIVGWPNWDAVNVRGINQACDDVFRRRGIEEPATTNDKFFAHHPSGKPKQPRRRSKAYERPQGVRPATVYHADRNKSAKERLLAAVNESDKPDGFTFHDIRPHYSSNDRARNAIMFGAERGWVVMIVKGRPGKPSTPNIWKLVR